DPVRGRKKDALAQPGATAADKASLGFALGKTLDACGAYDRAFDAYAAANRQSRESARPRAIQYDRRRQELFVDQLIATFPGGRSTAAAASSATPIFICGMFRSGSTLAEQVLAGHSLVTAGGEIDFLPTLVQTELAPFPARMVQLTSKEMEELAARYLAVVSKLFPGAPHVTDKR